ISALVDPLGRIVTRTGQWRAEVLVGEVPVVEGGASTVYMRTGDLVGWLAWIGVLAGLVADHRGRRPVVPRRARSTAAALDPDGESSLVLQESPRLEASRTPSGSHWHSTY